MLIEMKAITDSKEMTDKTFQLDVQDLLAAKDELLMSAQRELAIAVARGNMLLRKIAELEAQVKDE